MEERHNIVNLVLLQCRERGHAFVRAAITDHRLDLIAVLIVAENRGADQVRAAPTGCIVSMAESTARFELLLAAGDSSQILFGSFLGSGRHIVFRRLLLGRS